MVSRRPVAIVSDSSSCLPRILLRQSGIIIAPHQLIADGQVYRDGLDLNTADFYRLQAQNGVTISTSGPNPQTFLEAFEAASEQSDSVLCITLSPRFSPVTYDSALIASRMAKERWPELNVQVVDSRAVAGSQGFVALEASRAAQEGLSMDEIIERMDALIPRLQLVAFLDTLKYLGRSGKITKAKAWAGTLLGFRPLVELSQGEALLVDRPRSVARAVSRLMQLVAERSADKPTHVNVMHANAPDRAEELRQMAESSLNCCEMLVSEFTPVMGAHTGPGLAGVAFYSEA